ncbi:PQQ-binding-like beta-propeller repeat protein [Zavarzinella formosa]|uniref:PQQ-binding-like beta-propeller repeat protein n=1 Tax=Zavarzinella formosa TaxID=360055 RepID=UPI0002EF73C2|nr:PQQ-binding-like beta-propeller repeat protein [Zavarzinella formosa]
MTIQESLSTSPHHLPESGTGEKPAKPPRVWPPVLLLGIFWAAYSVQRWTELGISFGFLGFLILMGLGALITCLFVGWWLGASRTGIKERFSVFAVVIFAGAGTVVLAHKSVAFFLLVPGLPLVLTAWALCFLLIRKQPSGLRGAIMAGAMVMSWGAFDLIRAEGMGGDGQFAIRWRWSATAEEVYLAELGHTEATAPASLTRLELRVQPGDWPGFRGPNRDGTLRDVRIATDWNVTPPKMVWRRRIGPAWSSIIVVGDRLFTQEQRGGQEAVVCLDAATGRTLWSHEDAARHEDVQGGVGPRATPVFADGRLYSLGSTGLLNCLDATTGERKWTRELAADSGAKIPMWGFSSSPLVVGNLVIVFAGGEGEKTLLAYRTDSGEPAWSAPAGSISYSSPQLASVLGETQLLFVGDRGLSAYDPVTGAVLWRHAAPSSNPGVPRSVQPRMIGSGRILFDAGPDRGTALIDVTKTDGSWVTTERWVSRQLKPSFNDFVVSGDAIYGFDGRILSCVDLQTGKRRWKEGHYGSGQVLLLDDQPLLLVISEEGEAVLVAADPKEHRELGRFKPIEGKTWNHPTITKGRLYVRNAQEISCHELRPEGAP